MARKKKKAYLTLIEWDDHLEEGGWDKPEDIAAAPMRIASVGWLIKEDNKGIVIASARSETGLAGSRQYIIKSCITRRKRLWRG